MIWMSVHFPKWQACHWKLGRENQYNFFEVYITSECIYPHPGSDKVSMTDCGGGMCAALEMQSPLNLLDGVDRAGRWGKPWGEKAANKIFLIPQSPWKGCCDLTFPVGLLWPLYHCQPTQCPWQGSTNNNPTTANVITSHSPFPAEPGTQSFNPTGGKGTFLTQCEYNQNMSQYF